VTEDLNIPVLKRQQVATGPRPPVVSRLQGRDRTWKKIAFFGHFDSSNFGNESTLQAILYHLRCFHPDADLLVSAPALRLPLQLTKLKLFHLPRRSLNLDAPENHLLERCEWFVLEYRASFTGGLIVL